MSEFRDTYITLLLFLLGAPALAFQIIGSDVRRYLLSPHNRRNLFFLLIPQAAALLLTVFLLVMDIIGWLPSENNTELKWCVLVLLVFACVVVWQMLNYVARPLLIIRLSHRITRGLQQPLSSLNQETLDDLVMLGQESRTGIERDEVLSAIESSLEAVITQPAYLGNRLDSLIHALGDITLDGADPSSNDNLIHAIEICRKVKSASQGLGGKADARDTDLELAYRMLSRLGQAAVRLPGEGAALACVDVLCDPGLYSNPAATQSLCEIGAAAIQQDRLLVATQALNYLDALLDNQPGLPPQKEISYDTLGLLAYFAGHGPSGRRLVRRYLEALQQKLNGNLAELVRQSIYHHQQVNRFTTADKIAKMWRDFTKKT